MDVKLYQRGDCTDDRLHSETVSYEFRESEEYFCNRADPAEQGTTSNHKVFQTGTNRGVAPQRVG